MRVLGALVDIQTRNEVESETRGTADSIGGIGLSLSDNERLASVITQSVFAHFKVLVAVVQVFVALVNVVANLQLVVERESSRASIIGDDLVIVAAEAALDK